MAGPSLTNLDNEGGFDLAYSHVMKRKQSVFSLYIGLLSTTQFRSGSSPGSHDKHEVLGPLLSKSAESSKTKSVDGQSAKHTLWTAKVSLPENMSSGVSQRTQLHAQYQSHVVPYPLGHHNASVSLPSSSSAPEGCSKPGEQFKEPFPHFLKFRDDVVRVNAALFKGKVILSSKDALDGYITGHLLFVFI